MKRELKNYRVIITDDEYAIVSDETEEHVVESANYVHTLLQEAMRKAPNSTPKRIATLTALRLASELLHAQKTVKQQEEKGVELVRYIDTIVVGATTEQ